VASNGGGEAVREAALALVALGYREQTAARMAGEAAQQLGAQAAVEDLIKGALQRAAE
jgi:Holliday junction resolvasome RuvABC DNA-binding subunit